MLTACFHNSSDKENADPKNSPKQETSETEPLNQELKATIEMANAYITLDHDYDAALKRIENTEEKLGYTPYLAENYDRIYQAHPGYNATQKRLTRDEDVSAIKHLGGGSSLVYRLIKDKQTFAAFKPNQTRKQSNPNAELAAYRLCPLIRCRFDIPKNVPVSFEFKQFSGLYARLPSNPPAEKEFKDLIITKDDNGTDLVTGTMKDWIPSFGEFPIEIEDMWSPWFEMTAEDLKSTRAVDAIEKYAETSKNKRLNEVLPKLKPHLQNISTYELTQQISNLLVFDFLINNWDRYSQKASIYGVNCQFANGRFMSIDNGAGFSQTPHQLPEKHLHAIKRFSELTYHAVKDLDKETTRHRLFPNASPNDIERFNTFWKHREQYISYIDSLIQDNGKENTLFYP